MVPDYEPQCPICGTPLEFTAAQTTCPMCRYVEPAAPGTLDLTALNPA